MELRNEAAQVIMERRSVRTFDGQGLDEAVLERVAAIIDQGVSIEAPFGSRPRVDIIMKDDVQEKNIHLGTYGVIKGEAGFLVSSCLADERSVLDTGYVLEHLVLGLWDEGIGTCWLGGTFNRRDFFHGLNVNPESIIPAVIPFGRAKERSRLLDGMMRRVAASDSRQDWSQLFFDTDFSQILEKDDAGVWGEPLEMLRLAPSASNKQPWRVVLNEDHGMAHLFIQHTPRYASKNFGFDMQMLDAGIALCHIVIILEQNGISHRFVDSDPGIGQEEGTEYVLSVETKG